MTTKPPSEPRAATTLGYPGARRRLTPLETAAAVAVILSCLIATAVMTGMLPVAMHRPVAAAPVTTRAAGEAAPVPAAVASLPVLAPQPNPNAAAGIAGTTAAPARRDARLATDGAGVIARDTAGSTEAVPAAMPAAPSTGPAASPVATPPATAVAATAETSASGIAPNPARNPATGRTAPVRHRHPPVAHHRERSGSVPSHGKTREEVIAELLRAKRDGSYSSAMEAYR